MSPTAHEKIEAMQLADRIISARQKMPRVVDHLLYLLELHENNALVLYSSTLSSQIPQSHAANAFLVFQRGMHQFEIVRLCALWDGADLDKENIPTVIELIDHPEIIETLAQEIAAFWGGVEGHLLNPSADSNLAEIEIEALRANEKQFGQNQADKARNSLQKAIAESKEILSSPKYASIKNLRDKQLAHSLSETRREKKSGPVAPMKYGDERDLLEKSLSIVESLYCWVNGTGISFANSREIDQRNAKALWEACSFDIKY